jgi:hypothetical protein
MATSFGAQAGLRHWKRELEMDGARDEWVRVFA